MKRLYKAKFLSIEIDNPFGEEVCTRCYEGLFYLDRCSHCGRHKSRTVRNIRRRKIKGKRGRNSGTTNSAKKRG